MTDKRLRENIRTLPSEDKDQRKTLGIALSGGGSRAIAFHLGCFRALNDLGYLDKIDHISSVSSGSIFSALYSYYDEPFPAFEERVLKVLRSGLQMKIFLNLISPPSLVKIIATQLLSGSLVAACSLLNLIPFVGLSLIPPFRRWHSRTNVFINVLEKHLFENLSLGYPVRNDIDVIINACELSTGSAFRFGNRETGNWRLGKIKNCDKIPVSEAVACSAAFPVLLPALDKYFTFERNGKDFEERVIITDGGVYDNTGVTCFEPDKDPNFSFNSFKPDYIFSFDAGHGIYGDRTFPYYFSSRIQKSYGTTFKKRQDSIKKDLHEYLNSGKIEGFIYSYLGQNDKALPSIPPDFITYEQVNSYPTDFKAMKEKDIELLSGRGEQLTRLLISHYNPEI